MSITSTTNGAISFEYDGKKERVLKNVTYGTTTSTLYLRGMNDYPLVEKTSSGIEKKYIYGPTGLIATLENNKTYYIVKDHLGSTRAVMNGATGNGVEYHAYNAWGELMTSQISPDVKYKYTGQEYDVQTGVYNYRARLYDEQLGRFYAMDPAMEGFSPYSYAGNNPVSFVDPDGRAPIWYNEYMEAKRQREEYDYYHDGREFIGYNTPEWGAEWNSYNTALWTADNVSITSYSDEVWEMNGGFHSVEDKVAHDSEEMWRDVVFESANQKRLATGGHYKTPDEAAKMGIIQILQVKGSLVNQREFGGIVYKNDDGTFSHTKGIAEGTSNTIQLESFGKLLINEKLLKDGVNTWVSFYHSHTTNSIFSSYKDEGDLYIAFFLTSTKTAYVWTRDGDILKWSYKQEEFKKMKNQVGEKTAWELYRSIYSTVGTVGR